MTQRYFSGLGSIVKLGNILEENNSRNVLLVSGKRSFSLSGAEKALEPIKNNFNFIRFQDFGVNPKFEDVLKGIDIAQENNIDMVISIGGGSVIDMAKLILAFIFPGQNHNAIIKGQENPIDPKIPHFSIPTTAGTGSESTHFAVLYHNKIKYSVAAPFLLPHSIILDGELVMSNSSFQKANNGLDALAQAIESHWSTGSSEESRTFSRKAIPILYRNLSEIVSGKAERQDFQDFICAANLAGRAINISKTTSPHAFSYAFTSRYGIPHGQAIWLTLPKIFGIHMNVCKTDQLNVKNYDQFKDIINEIISLLGISKINLVKNLEDFVLDLGLECSMEKLGANTEYDRNEIANNVNNERLKNNPVVLTGRDINHIFNLEADA